MTNYLFNLLFGSDSELFWNSDTKAKSWMYLWRIFYGNCLCSLTVLPSGRTPYNSCEYNLHAVISSHLEFNLLSDWNEIFRLVRSLGTSKVIGECGTKHTAFNGTFHRISEKKTCHQVFAHFYYSSLYFVLFQSNSFCSHMWFTFRSSAVMNINLLVKATSLKLFVPFILPLWLSHSCSGHYLWLAKTCIFDHPHIALNVCLWLLPFRMKHFNLRFGRLFFEIAWIICTLAVTACNFV